jgi:hypothetical protein
MSMNESGQSDRTPLWLWLIILLGFAIRLTGLEWGHGYSYFGSGDSMEAYSFAVDYARGEPRALYIDQPNYNSKSKLPGPLWSLFCFVGMRSWGSIDGAILATILINTAVIYLTWLLADRTLGRRCSLWAALLAATLPFPVYYSAFLYNPNVMPFFGALLFLALWTATQHDRSRSIFWVVLLLLIMPQFHLSGLALIPAVIIVLAISAARLNLSWLAGGLLAGAFLYVPYIRGEMAHGWHNTLAMSSGKAGHWWGGLKALTAPLNLLVNFVPQWTRNTAEYRQLGTACFGSFGMLVAVNLLSALVAAALLVGIFLEMSVALRGFWRSPRQAFKDSPGIVFLTLITVVPLLFQLVSRQSFHSRYAIILFPSLFALAGAATARWLATPRFARVFLVTFIVMVCTNVWFMPAMYRYQGRRIDDGELFYGSFRNLEVVYQHLKAHAGPNCGVQIDDGAYMTALASSDQAHSEADLIRQYTAIREKEAAALSAPTRSVTYTLRSADQVTPGDAAIAYCANGIALIAK